MDEVLQDILRDEETLFMLVGGTVAITAVVLGTLTSMCKAMAREKTRREIAAYIAEGSMSPEQGERLMNAGKSSC